MDACAIQIENPEERRKFIDSIVRKEAPNESLRCCFYRVPQQLRQSNEDAYVPMTVSIGPLFYGKPSLQTMEDHKLRYFQVLISRMSQDEPETFENDLVDKLVSAIEASKADVCAYYGEQIHMPHGEFVKMILLDSCFMIELFYKYFTLDSDYLMLDIIRRDILLLENQLPYFMLKKLYDIAGFNLLKDPSVSLNELATKFLTGEQKSFPVAYEKHVLGLVWSYHFFLSHVRSRSTDSPYISCASDLSETGLKFKETSNSKGKLNITFNKSGVLEFPAFRCDDISEALLRNLIALEQTDEDFTRLFTSYAILLSNLIKTEKDVRILIKNGIINNRFGSEGHLATAINRIRTGVVCGDAYMELINQVNEYQKMNESKRKINKWKEILMRDYFDSPWTIIKFIAATTLLILTFLQTLYAIKN